MNRANPVYIPRNHLVEESLEAATSGVMEPLQRLLRAVTRPYDERPSLERYATPAPEDFGPYQTFCGGPEAAPAAWRKGTVPAISPP